MAESLNQCRRWLATYEARNRQWEDKWKSECSSVAQGAQPVWILRDMLQKHQPEVKENFRTLDGFASLMDKTYRDAVILLRSTLNALTKMEKRRDAINELLKSTSSHSGRIRDAADALRAAEEAKGTELERLESAGQIALREVSRRRSTVPMAPVASQADDITAPEVTDSEEPTPDTEDEIDDESDAQPSRSSDPSSSSTRPQVRARGPLRTVNTL